MFLNDQDKTPLRINKRNWVKQHNYSTQTLYEGLHELGKEMDISRYIDKKGKNFGENGKFEKSKCNEEINSIKKLDLLSKNIHQKKSQLNVEKSKDDKWKILEKNLNY